jgi:prophage tail gpP-like protein
LPDADCSFANRRAQWEANRRYGRSKLARVTVTGWRDGQGKLWKPNTVVNCKLRTAKVEEDRIICEVSWMRGEAGTQTMLTLMPKGALSPQPFAPVPLGLSPQNSGNPAGGGVTPL